jgi:anaerobic magnesium-protoporphyrin IX monomethyl ester cyclase
MVLLINAKTSKPSEINVDFFREPNNGLLCLVAILEANGIDSEILDLEQYRQVNQSNKDKAIIDEASKHKIIGLTSLTNTFHIVMHVASIIKDLFPKKLIVLGGPHVSFLFKSILKSDFQGKNVIDFICIGEAEYSFLNLVKLLRSHKIDSLNVSSISEKIDKIKGIVYINSKGEISQSAMPTQIIKLEDLPLPARYKLSPIHYAYNVANIIINRGCPNQCSFCSRQELFKSTRLKPLNSIIEELRDIKSSYMYKFINFYDNINLNKEFFEKICNLLRNKEFSLPWGCELRVDNITRDNAKLLEDAGCKVVATGIESASKEVLRRNFKYQDPQMVKRGIEYLKDTSISIQAYFVLGLPGETENTFRKTIDYIKSLPLTAEDTINYFIATPYPGSKLWEQRDKFRINIFEYDFSKYDCENLIFETQDLKKKQLEEMKKEAKKIEGWFS